MASVDKQLKALRDRIDTIDHKLLRLINQRARAAQKVAAVKDRQGEGVDYYRPDREAAVRRAVCEANDGPLSNEEVVRLFQEIMSACRALETPMRIGFLGPQGTFTEAAVLRHFGHSVNTEALDTIDAVFRDVEAGACDFGVVPVENSTEGVVNHTLDMFVKSGLAICGEVELRIHHFLLSRSDALEGIKTIYSHQQSLAQCRKWLDAHLGAVPRHAVSSNAEGARRCLEETGAAAIAGKVAAQAYGLNLVAKNIEDEPNNTTRFLVIGSRRVPPSGRDKTSLMLSTKNRPGALYRLLKPFSSRDISLTRIESRPSRAAVWEYFFFVDIEGHVQDENVAKALAEIERDAAMLKVLGSYPRAGG